MKGLRRYFEASQSLAFRLCAWNRIFCIAYFRAIDGLDPPPTLYYRGLGFRVWALGFRVQGLPLILKLLHDLGILYSVPVCLRYKVLRVMQDFQYPP